MYIFEFRISIFTSSVENNFLTPELSHNQPCTHTHTQTPPHAHTAVRFSEFSQFDSHGMSPNSTHMNMHAFIHDIYNNSIVHHILKMYGAKHECEYARENEYIQYENIRVILLIIIWCYCTLIAHIPY